ncbi:Methenyltetrahydromethanopterin cyclohydrolase [Roseimaritima multifibrata]|uniref:Methenyltetrahydromethanopterin cyclohydrolase n=1 Tax=Roseimaritima multifibrata TaxID=1930274 RepID=A0A517ML22_9BACT|nr:methenyltetrahydromethanopterin cyclohydrolase [Roseimaritima multifibrata]QDS95540.1 Methenyltetrahydromethanopterin cyclohydrolase [Roseimaritima multifibrata]
MSLNAAAVGLCDQAEKNSANLRLEVHSIAGARILDAGIAGAGSLAAGLLMARVCLGGAAEVRLETTADTELGSDVSVTVQTDQPLLACLGGQYAGWPVQAEDYFAMGSGPMRMLRGREAVLESLQLQEQSAVVAGVLESDRLPTEGVIAAIAAECKKEASALTLCVAPSTSLAGTVQVVARSVETAMHKLHECGFDVRQVVSGWGNSPLPPMAKPGDTVGGIGRTNDAILYGGRVTLWVDADQDAVDQVIDKVPSQSSADYGRPFAEVFKDYEYDFYKVDPNLFSPAVVTMVNLRTGQTRRSGRLAGDVLRRSFGIS